MSIEITSDNQYEDGVTSVIEYLLCSLDTSLEESTISLTV